MRRVGVVVAALVLAFVFGGGDQYLGSLLWHPWAADVSLLSAPWLVLPFLAGWTQPTPRSAAWLGFGCTVSALLAYMLMTLSPVEQANLTLRSAEGFLYSSRPVLLGAVVTGPLFGWLGHRWGAHRAWLGAVATAATLCLEPLARIPADRPIRFTDVWVGEVAAGLALAAYVMAARRA